MLLAVDVGNTDTVFAVFEKENLLKSWRVKTVFLSDKKSLGQSFTEQGIDPHEIDGVIISAVVPSVDRPLEDYCLNTLGCEPVIVSYQTAGVPVLLDKPEEVGADRIVNAVAILEYYQSPAIVIDFGTATTFDVIDENGAYKGGAIAPGVRLSVAALHQATAKLPEIEIAKPEKVIGSNTVSAIQSGIYWGYVGVVEGIVRRITEELGTEPFILATGGLADFFAENTPVIQTVDYELTLKGLLKIYQEQTINDAKLREA